MAHEWINNTKTENIVVVGAGGFGRNVVSFIIDINKYAQSHGLPTQWEIVGIVDDGNPSLEAFTRLGLKYLGGTDIFAELPDDTHYVIAIGDGAVRRDISMRAEAAGLKPATIIHPDTSIGALISIAPGTMISPGARLSCNIDVGKHCLINMNATIGHDVSIGDYCSVFPLSAVSGFATLGEAVTIGANSAINPGVHVGDSAYVASGSSVTKDVDDNVLVAGVPAKVKKSLR